MYAELCRKRRAVEQHASLERCTLIDTWTGLTDLE